MTAVETALADDLTTLAARVTKAEDRVLSRRTRAKAELEREIAGSRAMAEIGTELKRLTGAGEHGVVAD